MAGGARVCLGQIGAAHGVRGEVRLRSFTADPAAITSYGPLETEDGRVFEIETLAAGEGPFRREAVRHHRPRRRRAAPNIKLYVPRERLPAPDEPDEFYHADLIGLAAVDRAGRQLGAVVAVHNFGAGDLIEMRPEAGGKTELVPFDETNVPVVDLAAGRIVVDPPAGQDCDITDGQDRDVARQRADDFPGDVSGTAGLEPCRQGVGTGAWALDVVDIRNFATDRHRSVDDTPAGGGPGMVMKPDVLGRAIDAAAADTRPRLLLSPRGAPLTKPRVEAARRRAGVSPGLRPLRGGRRARHRGARAAKRSRSAIMCCPAAKSPPWR